MPFKYKVFGIVAFASLLCSVISISIAYMEAADIGEKGLIVKSEAILTRLESAKNFVASQGLLPKVTKEMKAKYTDGKLSDEDKQVVLNTVPIYASLKMGSDMAEKDSYKFRVFSEDARNEKNTPTDFEKQFIERFKSDPSLKQIVFDKKDADQLWVMRPVHLDEKLGCLSCHGDPATSPWKNGKDVLGHKMENWKDGHLHGVFAIVTDKKPLQADLFGKMIFLGGGGLFAILISIFLSGLFVRGITFKISKIANALAMNAHQSSEVSNQLGRASDNVSSASTEQAAAIQETMASMSEINAMVAKTSDVSAQTRIKTDQLADHSETSSAKMQSLASYMEELKQSRERLAKIGEIIDGINRKTQVVNNIVFKTQLLSVNASIEAARAGQHGKGFAVVAQEVSSLANLSGNAADEFTQMLESSKSHVASIVNEIAGLIDRGERISVEALGSFEKIKESIQEVNRDIQIISEASAQQNIGISQVSEAMTQMDIASRQNSDMATEVNGLSHKLVTQSGDLRAVSQDAQILVTGSAQVSLSPMPSSGYGTSEPQTSNRNNGNLADLATRLSDKIQNRRGSGSQSFDKTRKSA